MNIKFNIITVFFITLSLSISAQSKEELRVKEFFWGNDDKYKNAIEVPAKWDNESAVIIYKNINHDYHKFGKNVTYTSSVRKRIKLLDKAAVDEFSEFSFEKRFRSIRTLNRRKTGKNILGIKIIKPDGKEIEVDVNVEAIEVDNTSKVAIANLEVGDIIDYYIYRILPFKTAYQFGFNPVETTLSEEYPIMDFKLFFETENDFFINFNSFNGAPELTEVPTDKKSFRRYELVSSDIEKVEFPRWFYPLTERPAYKFQVYFARSGKFEDRALAFLPEKEKIIKKKVSKDEVLELYDNRFKPSKVYSEMKDFLKGKNFKSEEEKIAEVYYYMRYTHVTKKMEYFELAKARQSPYYQYYGGMQGEKDFINYFTEFLKRQKIGYEIIVAKKRYDGTLDELLIESNVDVLLKILTDTPMYATLFGPHTSINQYSPFIEGTDIYLLTRSKTKIDGIKEGHLPVSDPTDNETKKEIDVTLSDDFSSLGFKVANNFKGHQKTDRQLSRLIFSDYVDNDIKKYEDEDVVARTERYKNKKKAGKKYAEEVDALIESLKEQQLERFEEAAKGDFNLEAIDDYDFELIDNGRFGFDSYFSFTESYKVKNALIKKAGPNYIMEIGKLIGGQIEVSDDERERKENIHMNFPRTLNYNITLTVPEGYTVIGLEKLNKSVENSAGMFRSEAQLEGDKLVITTSKQYKQNTLPNTEWPNMVAFLDEAYQFTKEKVLIKKK